MVGERGKHLRYFKGSLSFGGQFPRGVVEMKIGSFQPHLVSNFPRGKVPSVSLPHDSAGSFMCCQGFPPGFFQGCQAILQGWEEGLPQGWVRSGFISM